MSHPTATEHVSMWIINDSDYYGTAQQIAKDGDLGGLEFFCLTTIRGAPPHSTPWQVYRQHSPAELDSVDWAEVASDLLTE